MMRGRDAIKNISICVTSFEKTHVNTNLMMSEEEAVRFGSIYKKTKKYSDNSPAPLSVSTL